jgi:FkbM family methyltransferase
MSTPYICEQFNKHIDRSKIKTIFQLGTCVPTDTPEILEFYKPLNMVYFECHPSYIPICQEFKNNYNGSTNLTFVPKVIFSYVGEIDFWSVPLEDPRREGFESSSVYKHPRIVEMVPLRLPCTTLDYEASLLGLDSIDLICADIEGSESDAFKNQSILNSTKYIICEAGVSREWKSGYPVLDDIYESLRPYGFEQVDFFWSHIGSCGEVMFVNKRLEN